MAGCSPGRITFSRSPVLLGFLLLFPYYATCQASVSLQINYSDHTIYFDNTTFQQFHECLCRADIRKCNVTSYRTENYITSYDVTNIKGETTTQGDLYFYSYNCTSHREVNTTVIVCSRVLFEKPKEDQPDSYRSCQNVPVNKLLTVSCSLGCFDILWVNSQNIANIDKDAELLGCGLCRTETSTGPTTAMMTTTETTTTTTKPMTKTAKPTTRITKPTTTTTKLTMTMITKTTTSTLDGQKGDDPSDDNIPLIVGVVVAVIVVLVITVIIIVIWWRRKRNSKLPSTSHHYTTSTGSISQTYEDTDELHGHVGLNGNGHSVPNPYVTTDDHSMIIQRPELQNGQAVADSYVSAEEVIQKKRAAAAKNSGRTNQGTEYASVNQDVPDTVISPDNGPYNINNNDNRSAPNPYSTTPASTTYSRLGEPVRNIQNPYDALQNPDVYSVAKFTPTNSHTSAHYSLAGPATSPSSTQDSKTVHNSIPPSQPTNRNAYDYEEVGANNMTTRPGISINNYVESPDQVYGGYKDGAQAPKVKESEPAENDYARLGEPVRNFQNPYNVTANQEEDGLQESISQALPTAADDPYSLARHT